MERIFSSRSCSQSSPQSPLVWRSSKVMGSILRRFMGSTAPGVATTLPRAKRESNAMNSGMLALLKSCLHHWKQEPSGSDDARSARITPCAIAGSVLPAPHPRTRGENRDSWCKSSIRACSHVIGRDSAGSPRSLRQYGKGYGRWPCLLRKRRVGPPRFRPQVLQAECHTSREVGRCIRHRACRSREGQRKAGEVWIP